MRRTAGYSLLDNNIMKIF